jgi:glycosyltransferase involved in cell wall biosynthesis
LTRTAFVIPWFGRDLVGGAEQHVFQVTARLAARGHHVEVLTTCGRAARDDWQHDYFPKGTSEESGILVRRFPLRHRDHSAFDSANGEFLRLNEHAKPIGVCPVSEAAARAFVEENIHSPQLLDYIERHRESYRSIVFAPYLYGPTLRGVDRAGDRALLQPLLHDETYAYLPAVESIFHNARRIFFISEGEAMLAARLFGPSMWRKGRVIGGGVEPAESPPGHEALPPTLRDGRYLLYLGRRERAKNSDFLLRAFERYRTSRPAARLELVLAGPGDLAWAGGNRDGVIDLGLVAEATKAALLAHCRALVQPSRNESFSRTMMEAWLHGRPVLVHDDCLATSRVVEASGGGWSATSEAEWAEIFAKIENAGDAVLDDRGRCGKAYAHEHADWDKVIDRYEEALGLSPSAQPPRPSPLPRRRAIHQLSAGLDYGDAISNQALFIAEILRDLGHPSEIFVEHIGPAMADLGRPFTPGAIAPGEAILYHHGIGSPLAAQAVRHAGPKALIYHNITPAHFFQRWDPPFARLLEEGRDALPKLAPAFPVCAGDSAYNAEELRKAGFKDPVVIPIFVDPMRWAQAADPAWMRMLQDGRTNLLFVGRVAPNKCQHQLVQAFHEYLRHDPGARLILVGVWPDGHPYARFVRDEADRLGVSAQVLLASRLSDAQLLACYRTAHLFWSMSEHEGFCVPVVEAMWFDVPVLAYKSSAVPETLGAAGIMFTEKRLPELAALAHMLVEDRALRRTVIAAQRKRRSAFLPEAVLPALLELLARLEGDEQVPPSERDQQPMEETSSQYPSMMRGQR